MCDWDTGHVRNNMIEWSQGQIRYHVLVRAVARQDKGERDIDTEWRAQYDMISTCKAQYYTLFQNYIKSY